MAMSEEEILT